MNRNLSEMVAGGSGPLRSAEAVARGNASRLLSGGRMEAPDTAGLSPAPGQPLFSTPGRELTPAERSEVEPRFARDFSQVRVHTDSVEAEALGARAFAAGTDIAFAPGESPATISGRALLVHELTHVLQQAEAGEARVQMDPKEGSGGIGSAPPSEPFEIGSERAPEDGAILFGFDRADIGPAAARALKKLVRSYKEPVTVQVHAYASEEGEGEYNLNLSAHRAVALKKHLETLLPEGSRVVAFAHGKTSVFGGAESNRRAGLMIRKGVEDPNAAKREKEEQEWSIDPSGEPSTADPGTFVPRLQPNLFLEGELFGPQPLMPRRIKLAPPVLTPPLAPSLSGSDLDWESMQNSFRSRALTLDDRWASSIEWQFRYSYNWFRLLLPHDKAVLGANLATSFMLDDQLSREAPNALDRSNQEFKRWYPDEMHLVIPVISSDILDGVYKYLSGSDKNEYKFRF
jgi:outer membrane protein OmpA-like peptidoglycan-associated protein